MTLCSFTYLLWYLRLAKKKNTMYTSAVSNIKVLLTIVFADYNVLQIVLNMQYAFSQGDTFSGKELIVTMQPSTVMKSLYVELIKCCYIFCHKIQFHHSSDLNLWIVKIWNRLSSLWCIFYFFVYFKGIASVKIITN